jgi:hypothetical protein
MCRLLGSVRTELQLGFALFSFLLARASLTSGQYQNTPRSCYDSSKRRAWDSEPHPQPFVKRERGGGGSERERERGKYIAQRVGGGHVWE